MKMHNDSTLHTDNVDQKDVQQFSIKANGKAFQILIAGLYSQKIDSVVREICSNAYDSHISAGKPNTPFDVTLPTTFEPTFSVRDFGIGLPVEKVKHLFTTIFESTKENSNSDIGAFGLGSKSPYAITDQFVIESRYNGVHSTFLAYKDGQGVPSLMTTNETTTDEPNGIIVSIPIKPNDIYQVQAALKRQMYFFPCKPTIGGVANDGFWHKPTMKTLIGGSTYIERNNVFTGHRVQMGPVSYPLDLNELDEVLQGKLRRFDQHGAMTISELPMGALDLQPSREGLSYIPQTKDALNKYFTDMFTAYDKLITDEFAKHQDNLLQCITWVSKTHYDQPYTLTIPFVTGKFHPEPVDIGKMIREGMGSLVKFENVKQIEKQQKLELVPDANDPDAEATPVVSMVDVEVSRAPFMSQSVSPRNKTVNKVFNHFQFMGFDQVDALLNGKADYIYIDDNQKAAARIRYYVEQTGRTVVMLYPNPAVHDVAERSLDAFANKVGKLNNDPALVRSKIKLVTTLDLPPVAEKVKVQKVSGHLSSVYSVGRSSLTAGRYWNESDLPDPADAPYIVVERGNVDSKSYKKYIIDARNAGLSIIAVSKSSTGDIRKLKALGHVSLEEYIDARAESWKYRVFITKAMSTVEGDSKIANIPGLFHSIKHPVLDEFKSKKARLTKLAEKCTEKLEDKQPFINLYEYFNDTANESVHCVRSSRKCMAFVKELNDLKRVSKKLVEHPIMLMVSNMQYDAFSYMEPKDKARVLKFVEENFNI